MKYLTPPAAIAVALAIGWLIYQNSLAQTVAAKKEQAVAPVPVEVMRVHERTLEDRAELVGSLEAVALVDIRARTDGYITKLPFDVQDFVEAGEIVVELDASNAQQLVDRAEAALKVAKAQLRAEQAEEEQARRDHERQLELARSGVATAQQREQTAALLEVARAQRELQEAQVSQFEADLRQSRLGLEQTRIVAPISGYVATRLVEVGDLADPTKSLLQIVNLKTVKTVVNVVERDYARVRVGQTATITVDAYPDQTFSGTVVRKAPVLDPLTRTAAVHLEIPNPDTLLKPGMYARVQLLFEKRPYSTVVPLAAFLEGKQQPTVYVLSEDGNSAEVREVVTGITDGELVEVTSGLKPGDRVITLGSRLVRHGQPVAAREVDLPVLAEHSAEPEARSTGTGE